MKWYRSETNKKLGGVCGGIAELYDWDVTVVRIVVFALLFTPVPVIIAYFAAWFIIPKKGELDARHIDSNTASDDTSKRRTKSNKEFLAE
jgi:phage shock protein PspC (stress-responsive transcriptional regulator)